MSRNHKFRVSLSASIGPPKYVIKIQDWPSLPWDWLKHRIFVFEDFIWIVQAIRNQNQMWRSHSVPPISLKVVRFCANLGLANCWKKTNSNFAYQMISPIFPQYIWTLSKLQGHPWPLCKKITKKPMDLVADRSVIIDQECARRRRTMWRSPSRQIGAVAPAR